MKERRVRKYHYTIDWNVISCEESSDPWWKLLLFILAQKTLFKGILVPLLRLLPAWPNPNHGTLLLTLSHALIFYVLDLSHASIFRHGLISTMEHFFWLFHMHWSSRSRSFTCIGLPALDLSHASIFYRHRLKTNHGSLLDTIPLYPLQALAFIKPQ